MKMGTFLISRISTVLTASKRLEIRNVPIFTELCIIESWLK